jgi:hypothetical protein
MGEGYGDKVFHNKCHWVTNIYLVDRMEIVMLLHKLVGQWILLITDGVD